jgi:endonuclease YncB( thermonuclease family)
VLTSAKQQLRVRIAWIDAPEKSQAFGSRAKQAMSELLFGKDVELEPYTIDRYGRLVAVVYVDGVDAGLELLKQGMAWVYDRYVSEASPEIRASYRAAQAAAQSGKLGLWQDPEPVPPWLYRAAKRASAAPQAGWTNP